MRRVQLHQLEYFVAVAETGSFTRGAARAGVVQSAVSTAVAQLERELDAELFERRHRSVAVTAAGEALLPRARAVLTSVGAAKSAVADARGEVAGTVMLGTLAYTAGLDLAALLQAFQLRYPRVAVHLRQTFAGSETSMEEVRAGTLDLALVSTPTPTSASGLVFEPVATEPLRFMCAADHRLATAKVVSLTDLADEPFIDYPSGWGNRAIVDQAFAAAGVRRSIRTEVTDFRLARSMVHRGLGVSIVPARATDDTVVAKPLTEDLAWPMQLVRPAGRHESRAAVRLAEAVTAWMRSH